MTEPTSGRSSATRASRSIIEARVTTSWSDRPCERGIREIDLRDFCLELREHHLDHIAGRAPPITR